MSLFDLQSPYDPTGDQPKAIRELTESFSKGHKYQTLVGVTGSGKTYTMANVIKNLERPALVISHNKTLAAQLYSEFKSFFPNNAVEYFVSFYDYYQPEAYIPQSDTYIEKDSSINDEIERFRISSTSSLLNRRDVIVVASVSCIYSLGSPQEFEELVTHVKVGQAMARDDLLLKLINTQYNRDDLNFKRGKFRIKGQSVDVFPADSQHYIRIEFWGNEIESITQYDSESDDPLGEHSYYCIYPANPYITNPDRIPPAVEGIRGELEQRLDFFEKNDKLVEAQRLKERTQHDIELLQELGFCSGIENYSRHLSGRPAGSRPWCLLDFFPDDYITIIDESHVSLPQIQGMHKGDSSRKQRLVDFGFRLPSALDNRPLYPEEFDELTQQVLYVSATPARRELDVSQCVSEQLIRPTGLIDPIMEIFPIRHQVEHLIGEAIKTIEQGNRVLVTTLTKRMSEDLTAFMRERDIRVEYLHSDIDAIERVEILRKLREGNFDVLVGVNLLREGLDLPEVALVAIMDADKEGFLRSETSIIQTAGRAARHEKGRVILYADKITYSMQKAIDVTTYRRESQQAHNKKHGITPKSAKRSDQESLHRDEILDPVSFEEAHGDKDVAATLAQLESEMIAAANELQFEKAAIIRDQINAIRQKG